MAPRFEVRPIGARALKSAIDTLRPQLFGARVLDLFAGQGRFGTEALQEGASFVSFVELSRTEGQILRGKLQRYPDRCEVCVCDAFAYLTTCQSKYAVLFADPPYPLWKDDFAARLFASAALVAEPQAIFLVKHPSRMLFSNPSVDFIEHKRSRFGEADLLYFRYEPTDSPQTAK